MTQNNKWTFKTMLVSIVTTLIVLGLIFLITGYPNNNKTNLTPVNTNTPTTPNNTTNNNNDTITNNTSNKDIVVTIIDDKRCVNCNTDLLEENLKQAPFLKNAKFVRKDFSDKWVEKFVKKEKISLLPAVLLNKGKVDPSMDKYLTKLDNNNYSLAIGAKFNPFVKRSDKWFLMLNKKELTKIKDNSFIHWKKDAKITWLEYSDLECPFCAKLHNSSTPNDLETKYGDKLNQIYNHFPLNFHKDALKAAQALECIMEQKWKWHDEDFYTMIKESYKKYWNNNFDLNWFYDLAKEKLNVDIDKIKSCVKSEKYKEKVLSEQSVWANTFGVTWTPWNVLINNETWEYAVISWAYPTSEFEKIIDKLLK